MTRHRTLRTAILGLATSVALLWGCTIASAAVGIDDPQLSIAIDDGQDSADQGDVLDYTITVVNDGSSTVKDVRITQTLPPGVRLESAERAGQRSATEVRWRENIAAGDKVVLHSSVSVGATPEALLRLASVACALLKPAGPPLVCSTDSNLLPAGVAAADTPTRSTPSEQPSHAWWYVAGSVGLVLAAGAVVVGLRRRRRRRADATDTDALSLTDAGTS